MSPSLRRLLSRRLRPSAPVAALVLALLAVLPISARAEPARLTLLQINDVYEIAPVGGRGGLAPLMTLLQQERAAAAQTLTVVSGDFLSPSLLSGIDHGAAMVALLNAIGVDLVTFGNHEFDFGPSVTVDRIGDSQFRWIGTNVLDRDGRPFGGSVAWVVEPVGDHVVGFIGLLTPDTAELSSGVDAVTFTPVIDAARQAIAELRGQGADVIVALTHLSVEEDRALARAVPEIAVILGGHEHEPMTVFEHGVLIHKSGSDAHWLGVVRLAIDTVPGADGPRVAVETSWAMRSTAGVQPQPRIAALVRERMAALDRELEVTIGTTATALDSRGTTVRAAESTMGNLVADAMRASVNADVAIINGGGLRGDRLREPGTVLTRRDVLAELPFGNVTVLVGLTGAELRTALEHGVAEVEHNAGRFPQVSGLRFRFDPSRPPGERVIEVTVGDAPLDPERTYRVAITDFMYRGGDGYSMMISAPPLLDPAAASLTANAVAEYIQANTPVAPAIDGRIVRVE